MKSPKKKPSITVPTAHHRKVTDDNRSKFLSRHREDLQKLQRSKSYYGRILGTKAHGIHDDVNAKERIDHLMVEKNQIRAHLWVANNQPYKRLTKQQMSTIKCQINCQEKLSEIVNNLKMSIANTQREIDRVTEKIYKLNNKIIPECRHQEYVRERRNKCHILENRLETGMRMECAVQATNAKLRDELINLLIDRQSFNEEYSKMVETLTSDKKYLIELIEHALQSFEQCISMYEKIEHYVKKEKREGDTFNQEIMEMQTLMRSVEDSKFVEHKQQPLRLADLLPKELKRREHLRNHYKRRITVYREVIDKLLDATNTVRIEDVIKRFKENEDVYYTYFKYANEAGYHMTLINNMITRLYTHIDDLKVGNRNCLGEQLALISRLQNTLRQKRNENDTLLQKSEQNDDHVEDLFTEIGTLCEITECDASHLFNLLGDNLTINMTNLTKNTKMLEERVLDILACVFCIERPFNTTVQQIEKICEYPTLLNEIVPTQQCPECAQGEDLNVEEAGNNCILPVEDIHKKLFEKLTQPEMQYYLHNIEHCRLPRSRQLAANRNLE